MALSALASNGRNSGNGGSDKHGHDSEHILNALSDTVLVITPEDTIAYVNMAGEQFLSASADYLQGQPLNTFISHDSPFFSLLSSVRERGVSLSESGINLSSPRFGEKFVGLHLTTVPEWKGMVLVTISERSLAEKIDQHLTHRDAARSLTSMAAVLAHEVKNPLSGIRGAAQLLEQNADTDDKELTRLICVEADRICALVDRMGFFSSDQPLSIEPLNVHEILEHVRRIAQSGFGRQITFKENYDPSLPPIRGDKDLLIQVFLNLVKNAAEAAPEKNGEIILSTAYQHGVRLAVPGSDSRVELPLVVSVQDNGEGISDDLHSCLFDPFVTTKSTGTGLGLALVAKIVNDHGGIIDFESRPHRTEFRVRLPFYSGPVSAGFDKGEVAQ